MTFRSCSVCRAAMMSPTSEPVAIRITSGLPFAASARTYAPWRKPSVAAHCARSSVGTFWRVRTNAMGWSRASSATRQATAPGASTAPCLSDTVTPVGSKSPSPESAVWVDGFKSAEPPISVGNRGATAFMTFRPATRVAMPFSSRGRPEYPYPTHPAIRRAWPVQTPSPDRETRGRMLKFYRSTPSRPTFRARLPCESVRLPSRECKIVARSASLDSASLTAPHRRPRATHAI